MTLLDKIRTRYTAGVFVNSPSNTSTIDILIDTSYSTEIPFVSITVPVYNQEQIIVENLTSIVQKTSGSFELIIICDACSDATETKILTWHLSLQLIPNLTRLLVLTSSQPLFETSADNLGFFCSRGKYFLEIQADMKIMDTGYNMKLLQPFLRDPTIIGISGRCCCNFSITLGYGKLGMSIESTIQELGINPNYYYISNTCNRGPLLLDGEKVRQLGYLDEQNFFLDDSDHDLFARAYVQKGWICGYVPIDVYAPIANGSTRKERDPLNRNAYEVKKSQTQNGNNGFLSTHRHLLVDKEIICNPL